MLIAALLELKSRLMLPGRGAGADRARPGRGGRGAARAAARRAPLPRRPPTHLQRAARRAGGLPVPLGAAAAGAAARVAAGRERRVRPATGWRRRSASLLRIPEPVDVRHIAVPKVTVAERLAHLRALLRARQLQLRRGGRARGPGDGRGHAVRAARALQAGRATWTQDEPFGEIDDRGAGRDGRRRPAPAERAVTRRLSEPSSSARSSRCCSCRAEPVDAAALADATGAELHEVVTALERLREHYEFERRGLVLRELAGGWALSSAPRRRARGAAAAGAAADAAADRRRRPRRSRSSPTCSRSRGRRSRGSAASTPSRRRRRCSSAG